MQLWRWTRIVKLWCIPKPKKTSCDIGYQPEVIEEASKNIWGWKKVSNDNIAQTSREKPVASLLTNIRRRRGRRWEILASCAQLRRLGRRKPSNRQFNPYGWSMLSSTNQRWDNSHADWGHRWKPRGKHYRLGLVGYLDKRNIRTDGCCLPMLGSRSANSRLVSTISHAFFCTGNLTVSTLTFLSATSYHKTWRPGVLLFSDLP